MRDVMAREHELKLNITDTDISAAIRYLDPDLNEITDERNSTPLVIYASLTMLVLGWLGFIWLCGRIP
jgi:hypothetical protein